MGARAPTAPPVPSPLICKRHEISRTKKRRLPCFAAISWWTAWNDDCLILRQTAGSYKRSTSETTARPVVKGDGLATLLCMSCHRKLENIKELKLKLKLRYVCVQSVIRSLFWHAEFSHCSGVHLAAHEDFTRAQSVLVHLA